MKLDRETVRHAVARMEFFADSGWHEPGEPHNFDGVSWRPDFVANDLVACIVAGDTIPAYVQRRMEAAYAAGKTICCVTDANVLCRGPSIRLLSSIDSSVCHISYDGVPQAPKRLLKVLGEQDMKVGPRERSELVQRGIERCQSAQSANQKGSRLEELVHFLFAQVSDFRVLRCNWRTRTEELDCVVQVRSVSQRRCWAAMSAPYIVIEAKNRGQKTGQPEVGKLRSVLQGKRGMARIGVFVSLSGFTSDAKDQVLRFAAEEYVYVLIDKECLCRWSAAEHYDDFLEELVTNAIFD